MTAGLLDTSLKAGPRKEIKHPMAGSWVCWLSSESGLPAALGHIIAPRCWMLAVAMLPLGRRGHEPVLRASAHSPFQNDGSVPPFLEVVDMAVAGLSLGELQTRIANPPPDVFLLVGAVRVTASNRWNE